MNRWLQQWATDHVEWLIPVTAPDTYREVQVSNRMRGMIVDWSFTRRQGSQATLRHFRKLPSTADDNAWFADAAYRLPGLRFYEVSGPPAHRRLYIAHWLVSVVTLPLPILVLFR